MGEGGEGDMLIVNIARGTNKSTICELITNLPDLFYILRIVNIHPKRFLLGQTLHCNKSLQITTDSSRRLAVLHKRRGISLSFLVMLLALTIRYLESIVHVFLSP